MTQPLEIVRQELFCQYYVSIGKRTEAAIKAGYVSPAAETPKEVKKSANTNACKLMKKPEVKARIQELMAELASSLKVTNQRVLVRLSQLAFRDVRKMYDQENRLIDMQDLDDDVAAAVVGVETVEFLEGFGNTKKVKLSDPRAALDSISRMLGFNAPEKVDHTTKGDKMPAAAATLIDFSKLSDAALDEIKNAILSADPE